MSRVDTTDINMPGAIDGLTLAHRVAAEWPRHNWSI
jgi:hypothetical protein